MGGANSPPVSRPFAAFVVGLHSRFGWTDGLQECLPALAKIISPNIYLSLTQMIEEINQLWQPFELAPDPEQFRSHSSFKRRHKHLCDPLRQMAEYAVPEGSPVRPWYAVGAALGDYKRSEQQVDADRVQQSIQALPETEVAAVPALKKFLELGSAEEHLHHLLWRVLDELPSPDARRWLHNEDNCPIIEFANAVGPTLRELPGPRSPQLPKSPQSPLLETPCVKLFGPDEPPIVNGRRKPVLRRARYKVVKALIETCLSGRRLNKDELVEKSGHSGARKMMKQMAASDPDWEAVLLFSRNDRNGYGIK